MKVIEVSPTTSMYDILGKPWVAVGSAVSRGHGPVIVEKQKELST